MYKGTRERIHANIFMETLKVFCVPNIAYIYSVFLCEINSFAIISWSGLKISVMLENWRRADGWVENFSRKSEDSEDTDLVIYITFPEEESHWRATTLKKRKIDTVKLYHSLTPSKDLLLIYVENANKKKNKDTQK